MQWRAVTFLPNADKFRNWYPNYEKVVKATGPPSLRDWVLFVTMHIVCPIQHE